ncbi:MAG: hypothetical protein ACFFDN_01365 [Candidatus Hodarchaeota archaeon]
MTAETKPEYYMYIAVLIILPFVLFANYSVDISGRIDLSKEDTEYINNYYGFLLTSGIINFTNTSSLTIKQQDFLGEESGTGTQNVQDVLATYNLYRNKIDKSIDYYKMALNLPTIFILSLGFPIAEFSQIINIVVGAIWTGILIALLRLVRGS